MSPTDTVETANRQAQPETDIERRINELRRQRSAIDTEILSLGGDPHLTALWTCNRCGHQWASANGLIPKNCPKKGCRSYYWDRPREVGGMLGARESVVPRVREARLTPPSPAAPEAESPSSGIAIPPPLPAPPPRTPVIVPPPPITRPTTEERAIEEYENGVGKGHTNGADVADATPVESIPEPPPAEESVDADAAADA